MVDLAVCRCLVVGIEKELVVSCGRVVLEADLEGGDHWPYTEEDHEPRPTVGAFDEDFVTRLKGDGLATEGSIRE